MSADGQPVSTLIDYLHVLRRCKWIVIPPILVTPVVAMVLSVGSPVTYSASAQVLVNRQNLPANLTGVNDPTQLDSSRLLTTESQFARLPTIAIRTLRSLGLNGSASDLLGASSVTSSDNSDFLTFTVSAARPSRAVKLATAYARQYVAYRRDYEASELRAALTSVRRRIAALARAGTTKSPLYSSLASEANQLAAMETVAATQSGLVRAARGAGRSASPLVLRGIFGVILGLISGVGLAFLWDAFDQRARSATEIGRRINLPLLGRLPRPPRNLRRADRLAMVHEPDGPYAEPFRMLRATLEFVMARRSGLRRDGLGDRRPASCRRVMVASALEGEGKSTTVANLAVAFACAGWRVLLVDLDFRRASLHRFFGLSPQPGLTDVVFRSMPLDRAISYFDIATKPDLDRSRQSLAGSLGVLPLGAFPGHADGMALTVGLERVFSEVVSSVDIILIDTPPLLRVGDALALTAQVDDVLVVADLRSVRPATLDELRRVLEDCPATSLGFILTGADIEDGYEYLRYPYQRALNAG